MLTGRSRCYACLCIVLMLFGAMSCRKQKLMQLSPDIRQVSMDDGSVLTVCQLTVENQTGENIFVMERSTAVDQSAAEDSATFVSPHSSSRMQIMFPCARGQTQVDLSFTVIVPQEDMVKNNRLPSLDEDYAVKTVGVKQASILLDQSPPRLTITRADLARFGLP